MFAPYSNGSENGTATWHVEPTYRGTYTILSTCLVTLGLCVWNALHLNIPAQGSALTRKWREKLGWLLVGIFAPELVAWVAFEQQKEARVIHKCMLDALGQVEPKKWRRSEKADNEEQIMPLESLDSQKSGEPVRRRHRWTRVHSHFAGMGGFAFDLGTHSVDLLPSDQSGRLTLTASGIQLLAAMNPDMLATISEAEIRDKSKASGLAKALVCVQAAWFCVQCVFRLICGLSISLLELNTFVHAVCALLIYLLWWNKPLDVDQPTILEWTGWPAFTAHAMYRRKPRRFMPWVSAFSYEFARKAAFVRLSEDAANDVNWRAASALARRQADQPALEPSYIRVYEGESVHGLTLVSSSKHGDRIQPRLDDHHHTFSHIDLSPADDRLLKLSAELYTKHGLPPDQTFQERLVRFKPEIGNWPGPALWRDIDLQNVAQQSEALYRGKGFHEKLWAFALAGTVYGGLHLSAWNAYFPHPVEQLLWRVAGICLASSGLFVIFFVGLPICLDNTDPDCDICYMHVPLLFLVWLLFYGVCRVYLVVECYRGLVFLPESAFQVPMWSQYIPHIS